VHSDGVQPRSTSDGVAGRIYAVAGIALFVIGGMVLEDAMGSDGLTLFGLVCLASGLVGIIAGGVSVGTRSRRPR
jgi:hypothetical protein